jgi:hypothetical protein
MSRDTLAEMADQGAANISAAQSKKAELSVANKAVHKFGGEDAILEYIANGGTTSALCKVLGVAVTTFDRWVDRGGETRRSAYAQARARWSKFSRANDRNCRRCEHPRSAACQAALRQACMARWQGQCGLL